jgi:hypothetical protein
MSCYVHNVPGRLRIRATKLKYPSKDILELCQALEASAGIINTEYNPKSGSLIIFYETNVLSAEDILYQLHKTELLKNCPTTLHHSANRMGTVLGSALFGTLVKKSIETSVATLARSMR